MDAPPTFAIGFHPLVIILYTYNKILNYPVIILHTVYFFIDRFGISIVLCCMTEWGKGVKQETSSYVDYIATIGDDVYIGHGVYVHAYAVIGDRVCLRNNCVIAGEMFVGADLVIDEGVYINWDVCKRNFRKDEIRDGEYIVTRDWLRTWLRRGGDSD